MMMRNVPNAMNANALKIPEPTSIQKARTVVRPVSLNITRTKMLARNVANTDNKMSVTKISLVLTYLSKFNFIVLLVDL